ncbi:MAG: cytochrome c, partial [Planctomycetes bacterium]|nr:cytochrome c [Planctomycetota bacterium]
LDRVISQAASRRIRRWFLAVSTMAFAMLCAGCGTSPVEFRANDVYVRLQEDAVRAELTDAQRKDIADILHHWFGSPDDPRVPAIEDVDMTGLLDVDRLQMAAGPVGSRQDGTPFGVYRKHCAVCHGVSGDGVGPVAAFLNPYPRDFRRGIFKYKSTAGAVTPPTAEDLRAVLVRGMPGTSMPSFHLLSDAELDALVDYVKYLSIRGAVERALIVESVDVLDGPEDRLVNVQVCDADPEELRQELSGLTPLITYVVREWLDAPSKVVAVPPRPSNWDLAESIRRGRELYMGEVANCVKCHGQQGRGDGETIDYDDWTKEIFDPQNPDAIRPYLALGALKPRRILPRNFQRGIFRGGSRPEDLYLRIHNGIPGTPMPAAPMKSEDARPDDIRLAPSDLWHLVDYVLSLSASNGKLATNEEIGSDQAITESSPAPPSDKPAIMRSSS